jgi:hypothetical protein
MVPIRIVDMDLAESRHPIMHLSLEDESADAGFSLKLNFGTRQKAHCDRWIIR